MRAAYQCAECDAVDPEWRIDRIGDAVVSWACDQHLAQECHYLQRAHEVTELRLRRAAPAKAAFDAISKFGEG